MNDPNTIHHLKKIHACIKNARQFESVLDKYGSFRNYLDQFDPFDENKLNDLKFDLMKRFEFLGGITVFHFLTNLGFNVLKPDRVVCRVFERLGLISDRNDIYKAVEVGKKFSEATGYPIRCIDIIFAKYGQMGKDLFMGEPVFGLEDGICFEKNPKCFVCGVKSFCRGC
jgi:DNA-3-methyladenine glycosylase I